MEFFFFYQIKVSTTWNFSFSIRIKLFPFLYENKNSLYQAEQSRSLIKEMLIISQNFKRN
ncbi:hypothetical protein CCYN2B_80037 [Capnocytophaga cynodegmi]|uniref:Uncharacterized protein n=1 Tax=Capnocytophaga cynodegmi TaxID=28189 RepID=A0A0B7HMH0_9FLAO|nr:hypothetical protein CCYN2B_80037 [Capnocytophaga cynodegmi]